jgi:CRP/FNR family transcriptional regulator
MMAFQGSTARRRANGGGASQFVGIDHPPAGLRCELPSAIPLLCGNEFNREDREPDSEVIAGGPAGRDVWLVRSGILRLQRHSYDGHRQILSLFLPGEIVGFEETLREGLSVETVTASGLCRIDRRRFDALLRDSAGLRTELFRQKQDQLDRLHWLTWSLGTLNPEERFCAFLSLSTRFMPCQRLADGSSILTMQLPRVDIADLLGTTVETISRITRKLSDAGLIETVNRSQFRILDLARVTAIGRIEANFYRMVRRSGGQSGQAGDLAGRAAGGDVCFCGR